MAENLHLGRTGTAHGGDVLPGALPGQHHPLTAIVIHLVGAAGGEQAHLRAGVEGEVRQRFPEQGKKAPVLHENGIHPQTAGGAGGVQRGGQLPVRYKGIQGEKDPDAPDMTVPNGGGKFLVREIFGAPAGVERAPAQIHRAAAALHGGTESLRRTGGG